MSGVLDLLKTIQAAAGSTVPGSGDINKGIANIGILIEKHTDALNRHCDSIEKHLAGNDDFKMETLAAVRMNTDACNRLAESIEKLLNVAKHSE